jgi:hypothetical protein
MSSSRNVALSQMPKSKSRVTKPKGRHQPRSPLTNPYNKPVSNRQHLLDLNDYNPPRLAASYRKGGVISVADCYITEQTQSDGVIQTALAGTIKISIMRGRKCSDTDCNAFASFIIFALNKDAPQQPYISNITVSCSSSEHVPEGSYPAARCAYRHGLTGVQGSLAQDTCWTFATKRHCRSAYCPAHLWDLLAASRSRHKPRDGSGQTGQRNRVDEE